jgi:hypothetical protein
MVHLFARFTMPLEGWTLPIIISVLGLESVGYMGYMPDPIDWAKKSKQTAVFAAVSYLAVTVALFVFDPPA